MCSLILKDLSFNFYLLLLQLVLCRVAALKSLPVHHPLCRLHFPFGPLRSARVFSGIRNLLSVKIHFLPIFNIFGPIKIILVFVSSTMLKVAKFQ